MILFEMYLNDQLIDTATPCRFSLQTKKAAHLKCLIDGLRKKHADTLATTTCEPQFILSGIPSCINCFVPLRHP